MGIMLKKLTRPICLLLAIMLMLSCFAGCSDKEAVEVPVLVPEEQLFADEYEVNEDITNHMSYYIDYIRNLKMNGSYGKNLKVVKMFNMFKVQVDDWSSVVVGKTTMGEITNIINIQNDAYVKNKTQAIIDERQALIDKEYNEAKAKAEAAGKEYNKAKKEVRTDDIKFDTPYEYKVLIGEKKDTVAQDYEATRLIDPSKFKVIFLDVSKYGIPYVRFEFRRVNGVCNQKITQESDWILNGVYAADVSAYGMSEDGKTPIENPPSFVDVDGRNKAAKKNIVMTGNIAFGGDGFTWDSLMLLCEALELEEGANEHGFKQTSDENFTYYTIVLGTNMFESDDSLLDESKMIMPYTRLVATFDPLTQVCLNWTIDCNERTENYTKKTHELTQKINVNVREYQLDTTDYEGMRNTIKNWIADHSYNKSSGYVAVELTKNGQEETVGLVETGLKNLHIEPVINGVKYQTITIDEDDMGNRVGQFISLEDLETAYAMEKSEDMEKHIEKCTKTFIIRNCALSESGEILGAIVPGSNILHYAPNQTETYYIVEYEMVEGAMSNVKVLTYTQIEELLYMYAKTYRLTTPQYEEMVNVYNAHGIEDARQYITDLFAAAEQAQKDQGILPGVGNDKVNVDNKIVYKEPTTKEDINVIIINDKIYSIQDMNKSFFKDRGYGQSGFFKYNVGVLYNIEGDKLSYDSNMTLETVTMAENEFIDFFGTNDPMTKFINGVHVGMTEDEAREALESLNPEDVILEKGSLLVVTTEEYNLVINIEPEKIMTNDKTNKGEEEVVVEPENYVVEIHLIREKEVITEGEEGKPENPTDTPEDPTEPDDDDDEIVVDPDPDEGDNGDDETTNEDENTDDEDDEDDDEEEPGTTPGDIGGGILGAIGVVTTLISIISGAVCILMIVAQWRIFVKAGEAGWKCLVPIYGQVIFYKISMGRGIYFLSWIIPPVGAILTIIATYRLFQKFEKSTLFCIGGIFFSPIMMLIVAFDGSCYDGQPLPEKYQKKEKAPKAEKSSRFDKPNNDIPENNEQPGERPMTPPPVAPKKPAKSSRFGKKSNPKDEGAFK